MKEARVVLFDVESGKMDVVMCKSLDDYYKYLKCDCFDIAVRHVKGREFDIYVDDEGLLKEHPLVSAVDSEKHPALVGNLIFAHHDSHGNTTSVTDDDIEFLKCRVWFGVTPSGDLLNFIHPVDY